MKTGLFFGSFNPVHIGHMAMANYMLEYTEIEEVWFVISPHNPFKKKNTLLTDQIRLELVELAIGQDSRFRASDIEFRMPTY
jgi:nicotinate-nucleotide adenylyltransferase